MKVFQLTLVSLVLAAMVGCGDKPKEMTGSQKVQLDNEARAAIDQFRKADPGIEKFFSTAYAYAIFPDVKAGAMVVGGAHGEGAVFRNGVLIGYADVSKADVGAQVGGQSYSQLVFFENAASFGEFTRGTMELDAKASAVAASHGASTAASYQRGVLVFSMTQSGLMVQAAIGGQKFRYTPIATTMP
jgi:lipid-binding SYLF domain-containing protein